MNSARPLPFPPFLTFPPSPRGFDNPPNASQLHPNSIELAHCGTTNRLLCGVASFYDEMHGINGQKCPLMRSNRNGGRMVSPRLHLNESSRSSWADVPLGRINQ